MDVVIDLREQSTEPEWVEADRIPPDKTKELVISKSERQDLAPPEVTTTGKQSHMMYKKDGENKDRSLAVLNFLMISLCCLILLSIGRCCLILLINLSIIYLATLWGKIRIVIVFLYYCLTFLFFSLLTYYHIRPLNFFQIRSLNFFTEEERQLISAVEDGDHSKAKWLLPFGVSPHITDWLGRSLQRIAYERNYQSMYRLLRHYQGKPQKLFMYDNNAMHTTGGVHYALSYIVPVSKRNQLDTYHILGTKMDWLSQVPWLKMDQALIAALILSMSKRLYWKARHVIEHEYLGIIPQEWTKSHFVLEPFI